MHKYFAKPLFLAKSAEFLPECHSTNEEMLNRVKSGGISEGHLIYTDSQLNGRGQRGSVWQSQKGRNLLFSIYLKPSKLLPKEIYLVNLIAGLAAAKALENLLNLNIELKWPNDLYARGKKMGGILVESSLNSGRVEGLVIGMGLNVNQVDFSVDTATSLALLCGRSVDRLDLLENVIVNLEGYYLTLRSGKTNSILAEYYQIMRWRGEIHLYRANELDFEGEIIGVDESGRLIVKTNGITRRFGVKEITFIK